MSRLQVDRCNIVIIGAWNTAIIQPAWLQQSFPDLLNDKTNETEVSVSPVVTLAYTMNGVRISPWNGRLILSVPSGDDGLFMLMQTLATRIFDKLPETPVSAVGHNVYYSLDDDESFWFEQGQDNASESFFSKLGATKLPREERKDVLSFEDHVLNVTYQTNNACRELAFNYHFDTPSLAAARTAIKMLLHSLEHAKGMSQQLCKRDT